MKIIEPETACRNCGEPVPSRPGPGRPRSYCSTGCRRVWWYGKQGFVGWYTEEWRRRRQERWEWMVEWHGVERADEEAARFIAEVAEAIERFGLDVKPWKPDRRKLRRLAEIHAGRGNR